MRRPIITGPFAIVADLMAGLFLLILLSLILALNRTDKDTQIRQATENAVKIMNQETHLLPNHKESFVNASGVQSPETYFRFIDPIIDACQKELCIKDVPRSFGFSAQDVGPGYVRVVFDKSLFELAAENPRIESMAFLRLWGCVLGKNLDSKGGKAKSDNPIPDTPCVEIRIQGHADKRNITSRAFRFRNNLELSALRAIAVEEVLRQGARLDQSAEKLILWNRAVSISGFGERQPLPGRDPDEDDNRRIWVELIWHYNLSGCKDPPPFIQTGMTGQVGAK